MCTANSIAVAVATVVSAALSVQQIQTQKAVTKYQARQMEYQAEQNKKKAEKQRIQGLEEARNKKLQAILRMGDSKTRFAAGNILASSATSLNVNEQHKLNGELEALNTMGNAEDMAENSEFQAEKLYSQAALTSFNSRQQYNMGMIKVASNTTNSFVKQFDS